MILAGCVNDKKEDFEENVNSNLEISTQKENLQDKTQQEKIRLDGYKRIDSLVYFKGNQFYTISNNGLSEMGTHVFTSTITYKELVCDIRFRWSEIGGVIYTVIDEMSDGDFVVEEILGRTDVVLLNKLIPQEGIDATFLCDLSQEKVKKKPTKIL